MGDVKDAKTNTRARTAVAIHDLLFLQRFCLDSISDSATMAITVVDSLVWLEFISGWVSGERRWLVFRLSDCEVFRRVIMLVRF